MLNKKACGTPGHLGPFKTPIVLSAVVSVDRARSIGLHNQGIAVVWFSADICRGDSNQPDEGEVMELKKDGPGHYYIEVDNVRLTYVPACDRGEDADWCGKDVIRFQAYRDGTSSALHRGAELPIADSKTFLALVEGLCLLYRTADKGESVDRKSARYSD